VRPGRTDSPPPDRNASRRGPSPRHNLTVQASVIHEFGPPSVLVPESVPDPAPGPDQVIIEVEIANVTFVETQVRSGHPPNPAMLPPLPAILGNGVGGVVVAVGEDVARELIGRHVVSSLRGSGGYAQKAIADVAALIAIPDQIRVEDAAALLADGRTAMLLVRDAAIQPGDTVLVEAAAGGVGSLLVQLARNAGARVVGAAGSRRKLELARELGASVVVDYTDPTWIARVAAEVGNVDVVFDGVGGTIGSAAFELLRAGGRFCPFGMSSGAFARISDEHAAAQAISVVRGGPRSPEQLREFSLAALAEAIAGRLHPLIGQTFPLDRAADAHAAMEQRASIGKTLLMVNHQDASVVAR
jgi:NADPH2:quinone reductase